MSRISLLLHKSKVKPRTSVNNKDILRVWWGLTGFYPSALISHVFYQNYVLLCMYVSMYGVIAQGINTIYTQFLALICPLTEVESWLNDITKNMHTVL